MNKRCVRGTLWEKFNFQALGTALRILNAGLPQAYTIRTSILRKIIMQYNVYADAAKMFMINLCFKKWYAIGLKDNRLRQLCRQKNTNLESFYSYYNQT